MVPSMGTSIATFKLTGSFLQFHASGARKPLSTRCARAGKLGSSSCGMISSLIINFSPCISCGGPWVGAGFCSCKDVSSSNHVGRMVLCPSSPGCFGFFNVSRWILWNIGGTIHAGMKADAIPDPWPMAKIAIDKEKPAQWVTKMCRLYFADIYARKTKGIPTSYPPPGVEDTLREVQQLLPHLEAKMIEFLAEWIVTLLSPATQIVKARASHLTFMFVQEYWFREFYLGLKVTASLDREESYTRIIDGQVRCITQEHIQKGKQLIWNIEFLTIFVPAWMIPPIYHSLRRECIKNAAHSRPYGVRSVRPTWFEDSKIPSQPGRGDSTPFQPMHGLKLVIKEDVMPQEQMPDFPALAKLAANGFLSVETWNNKRAILNFKATVEIPMLGTMIENYGDTLEEAHMPLGWPISIDGAVRQFCMHKKDTIQELNSMLAEFNLQRSSVEINCNTNLWAHNAVWNKKFMDPTPGQNLQRLWDASEHYICRKASRSRDVPEEAIRQMVREIQQLQPANPPDNLFMQCLGRPQRDQAPPQNVELTRRALEEWERTICENKAMAILEQIQEVDQPSFKGMAEQC